MNVRCFLLFLVVLNVFAANLQSRFHEASSNSNSRIVHLRAGQLYISDEMVQHAKDGRSSFATATISPFSSLKIQKAYNPLEIELKFPQHRHSLLDTEEDLEQWLVHVKPPITTAFRQSLEDHLAPYTLGDYIPQNSYVVVCPRSVAHGLLSLPGVLVVIEFHSSFKIDPLLSARVASGANTTSTKSVLRVRLALKSLGHPSLADLTSSENLLTTLYDSLDEYKRLQANNGEDVRWMSEIKISTSAKDLVAVSYEEAAGGPSTRKDHVLKWLSSNSVVHWIEQHRPVRIQNRFARYVVQSDVPSQFDIWSHGVTGEGQVVAVGDTGVDYDHCLFWDPNHSVPVNTVNPSHRKIVTYATLMDDRTQRYGPAGDSEGHGTHTAASICGDSVYSQDPGAEEYMRNYNGMAYKAKLAVYDYQDVSSQDIYLPLSIYDEFFTPSYTNAGARLSSNSWGDENGQYDVYAEDTDRFAWDHPEMCIIFAAGNYGDNGFHSVASPGIAKNCLSIGSSLNAPESFGAIGYSAGISVVAPSSLEGIYLVVPADFGPRFSSMRQVVNAQLVMASPQTGCTTLDNADEVSGKIVVILRGQCEFSTKALTAQRAGASLMIVVNNDDPTVVNMEISDDMDPGTFTIPSVMISKQEGTRLFVNSDLSTVRLTYPVPYTSSDKSDARLSDFSSRGPTWDGRLKPDFCAPGDFIQSAKSDNNLDTYQCPKDGSGIVKMQGTSMAAPISAGAAALVRHYFEGGFYKPLGAFRPTSALVKAVMANSGKELSGQVFASPLHHRAKINVTSIPSFFQGYGRIKLDDVLYFNDSVGLSDFSLYIWDAKPITLHDHHSYCFVVKQGSLSTRPLKVTLAWIDYPALSTSSQMLTNNLDLAVVDVRQSATYLGNQGGDYPVYLWDDLNNMEQVIVKRPSGGDAFLVQVLGTQIPQPKNGGQPYSLVVTGPVDLKPADLSLCGSNAHDVICPSNCSLHGRCNIDSGRCECQPHYAGASCSILMRSLNTSQPSTGTIEPNAWIYYSFDVLAVHSNLKFLINTAGAGDPDFFITKPRAIETHGYDGYPTLAFHDYANTECDSCGKTSHVMTIPDSELTIGAYSLAVYGYCCEPSTFSITVSVTLEGAFRVSLFTTAPTSNLSFDNFTTELAVALNASATRLQFDQARTEKSVISFYLLPVLPLMGANDDATTSQLWERLVAALATANKAIQAANSTKEQAVWDKFVAKWSIDAAQTPTYVHVKMSYSDGTWQEDLEEDQSPSSNLAVLPILIPTLVGVLMCSALVCWLRRRSRSQTHPKTKKSDKVKFVNLPEDSTIEPYEEEEPQTADGGAAPATPHHPSAPTSLRPTHDTSADFKRPPLQTPERPKPTEAYRLDSPPSPSPAPTPTKAVPETPDSAKKEMMEVLHGISDTLRPRNLAGQGYEPPVPREKEGAPLIRKEGGV